MLHDDAIFAGEWNYVGDGGDGGDLQQRLANAADRSADHPWALTSAWASLNATPAPQRFFSGYGQSGRLGLSTATAGGSCGFGQMMIGDDHVDAELVGARHHFGGADAGVDADDELHALFGRGFHHFASHAIAVLEAVRNVKIGGAAGEYRWPW